MTTCLLFIIPSGAFGLIMGMLYEKWMYARLLVSKARPEGRTPEYINGGFYYIVPEREYVARMRIGG